MKPYNYLHIKENIITVNKETKIVENGPLLIMVRRLFCIKQESVKYF